MWQVLADCGTQLRVAGRGGAFALDYGAILAVGAARKVDLTLLSDVLPAVEGEVIAALNADGGEPDAPEQED